MNANIRADMRQSSIPPQTMMLGINNQTPFMQNSQQQIAANHMGLSNNSGVNPPMSMLSTNAIPQRYQPPTGNMHQTQQPQRQMQLRHSQSGQAMNTSAGPIAQTHMSGLTPGQLQAMGMQGNMMQQQGPNLAVRRTASQPQLNPGAAHLGGGLPQGVNSSMNMGMNSQTNMPAPLRHNPQQQSHVQQQQQQQQQQRMQQHQMQLSNEMGTMNRPGGNPGMPQNSARSGSAQAQQLMSSLPQPPSHGQVPLAGGMQPSHHQNNFQSTMSIQPQHQQSQMSSSPRLGSHSQTHTPNMGMGTPGPSHTPVNRTRMTPDNSSMFMSGGYPPQYPHGPNPPQMPQNTSQFPFVPSSTPPIQMVDIPQMMPSGLGNSQGGTPNHTKFLTTPVEQLFQMRPGEPYFSMPPPNVPTRPPSHNNHHPPLPQQQQQPSQQPQLHQSPHQQEHMSSHPQRPQSQPQAQPGRPPSQAGPSHTPRASQPQLPGNPGIGRIPPPSHGPPQPGHQPQSSGSGQHLTIAPRPPPPPSAPVPTAAPPTQPSDTTPPSGVGAVPRPLPNIMTSSLGFGQGLIRLLQFSGVLASENKLKLQLAWWKDLVQEYFTPKAVMKFTLWKDNQRNEAKPFEIGVPILPRFFLVTTQSGVKSMTLSLDGARERMYGQGHAVVECVAAVWTYKYHNGYTVTLRGPLTAHVVITASHPPGQAQSSPGYLLKFEDFQFDANFHDKYIALESVMGGRVVESPPRTRNAPNAPTPTASGTTTQQQQREEDKKWEEARVIIEQASIPGEPVNAFGIPQATMRCLELAESVGQMADLITFSTEQSLGPLEALTKFAAKLREGQNLNPGQGGIINGANANAPRPFQPFPNSSSVTLYSSAPSSVTNPSSNSQLQPPPPINSPQNAPLSAGNSPQKQHKSIPQQSQGSSSSSASVSSPTVSSGTTNTPALSNASLKRKQDSAASPTTTTIEQPPAKRNARKRGRTTGGG